MNAPYYSDERVTLHHGDCLDILRTLPDASVDAVVTDPPYGLGFMGKAWDDAGKQGAAARLRADGDHAANPFKRARAEYGGSSYGGNHATEMRSFGDWCELWATECLRVLKPGGHILAFGGTRTWHRLACAVEDAGFEIRDSIAWMYGSGFPKSLDVSKAIDKAAGAERAVVGTIRRSQNRSEGWDRPWMREQMEALGGSGMAESNVTAPATPDAQRWQGWGTALKPAFEPVVVARKPLTGTVAANVLTWGTGALNVDGCRIEASGRPLIESKSEVSVSTFGDGLNGSRHAGSTDQGRWPANVVLDESQAGELDTQSGDSSTPSTVTRGPSLSGAEGATARSGGAMERRENVPCHGDFGGASRFFYVAKADASERVRIDGTAHPTVKPLSLMRWLVRLVTPPGGTVLEPFAGSGTTVEACMLEGVRCIAIEREPDYLPLIVQRVNRRVDPVAAVRAAGGDAGLFDLIAEEPA